MSEEASPVLRMGAGTNQVSECGIIESPLIVGGLQAKSKEFPHMVSFRNYTYRVYKKIITILDFLK